MSDIKIFQLNGKKVQEIPGSTVAVEKSLQDLMENNLEAFLGVSFLASEYDTGKIHRGRIDTIGVDENGCPVIIEYKRATNQNVINQGLFYLDWLMDHKGEFELLTLKKLGKEAAKKIEWISPRLICIAGDFTKYDLHAVKQINRNIELMRYGKFGKDLIMLELVNAQSAITDEIEPKVLKGKKSQGIYKTVSDALQRAKPDLKDRFESLKETLMSFGDDVQIKTLKYYFAFKRIKNFACVEVHNQTNNLVLYVKVPPTSITLEPGFTRDVRNVGHFGTGPLEIILHDMKDIEKAKPLLEKSYDAS